MKSQMLRRSSLAGMLAVAAPLALPASAANPVSVTVNGQNVALNPPPIERAGRVFVPLRGIFERLGATVVYQNGTINATGNNRTISLHIGSTSATVDGQSQGLDVAPFVVGASTYVPLRFVSQALGSQVNFDGAHNIVAISTNGAPAAPPQAAAPPPTAAAESPLRLADLSPERGATVAAKRPSIVATFTGTKADPNSIKVTLDDFDITSRTSPSPTGIVYSPPSPLQPTRHTVRITGKDQAGRPFNVGWAFTSGQAEISNTISDLSPADGSSVGTNFTVSGHTLPNATVNIVVGAQQESAASAIGKILGINGGQNVYSYQVIADPSGNFSQQVQLGNAPPGTSIALVATSTDARTKTSSPKVQRALTVK